VKPHLQFGYVTKAHGLKGELVVHTFDPASTVLDEVERVWLEKDGQGGREAVVQAVREAPKGDLLVSLEGVTTREAAEALKGFTLCAFRDDLEAPGDDEVFQGDLVGLRARTPGGEALGVVEEVWSSGPVPNLVIRDGKRELMVPLVADFVREVDVKGGAVVVEPPEYA